MSRIYLFVLFIVVSFTKCMPIDEEQSKILFWTDLELNQTEVYSLYINDVFQENFELSVESASCGDSLLIEIPNIENTNMVIGIRSNLGLNVEVGVLNVFDFSGGIKVNSNYSGALFVEHDIDEFCTRVRVRW